MTAQEALKEVLEALSEDDVERVVQYARSLGSQKSCASDLPPLRGLWKDLGERISEEEIRDARKEMWGQFPRDDF